MEPDNGNEQKPLPSGLIPFKPGQSGNPGGRPKYASLSKACRDELDKINPANGLTGAEEVALALVKEAKRGNIWAIRELRQITEGQLTARLFTRVTEHLTETSGSLDGTENVRRRLYEKLMGFGVTIQDTRKPEEGTN